MARVIIKQDLSFDERDHMRVSFQGENPRLLEALPLPSRGCLSIHVEAEQGSVNRFSFDHPSTLSVMSYDLLLLPSGGRVPSGFRYVTYMADGLHLYTNMP